MSYKPDEKDWMAFLYGELEGKDKEKFELYLLQNEDARKEFEKFQRLRGMMSNIEDKEVIAPPIVITDEKRKFIWDAPYFKTVASIAASLIIILLVGKATGLRITRSENQLTFGFGERVVEKPTIVTTTQAQLTPAQVQEMINASLDKSNTALQASLKENEERLSASIRKNIAGNSAKVDQLVRQASTASQDQIQEYIAGLQADNMKMVKDYFQLTSSEQKKYIENMLVDFASYLQQQRNSDLQVVQIKLNSLEKKNDMFKQETEQILTSIISTVGTAPEKEIKN
jgi:hypothetical protein